MSADSAPNRVTRPNRRISIVIPVFNQLAFTRKCLELVFAHTAGDLLKEVIVVDNGSASDTREFLQAATRQYPALRVIHNEENQGFAHACNQGATSVAGDDILFLNNDTEVGPNWLEPLAQVLNADQTVAAVGPKLLYADQTIQFAGAILLDDQQLRVPLNLLLLYRGEAGSLPAANVARRCPIVTAACMLVRKAAFVEVQGFDEGYWNGFEDVDLCLKLRDRGWQIVYEPASTIIHHEGQSGPERSRREKENVARFIRNWRGKVSADAVRTPDGRITLVRKEALRKYRLGP